MLTIAAVPLGPDAYTTCYYTALQHQGVRVIKGDFSGRWLLANRRDVSYLHIHWPSFLYSDKSSVKSLRNFLRFILLLVLTRLLGIRLLWTAHNLYPHDRNKVAILDRLARKITVLLSYRIFVHGHYAASAITEEFPDAIGKIVIIPHGNWIGYYTNGCNRMIARSKLRIANTHFIFLFVGLCKKYKNLEYLIKSFQNGPFDEAMLWVVGLFQEDDYYVRIKTQMAHRPQRICLENRFVPNEELQYYLKACDVVVLPYTDILTSGSAMLAISFGRPVIAPRLGHLQDVINSDCGILYAPSDAEGLSRAMQEVQGCHFDEKVIMAHAGKFAWNDAAKRTMAALSP